jgi:predicted MPP superfamily phosphohydrolase
MKAQEIFDRLWKDYSSQNPSAKKIKELFENEGENVLNDHIAFRTFNDARINVDVLSKIFISAGYVEKGQYHFEEKKLFAKHFELENDINAPRIFISELIIDEFSDYLKEKVRDKINEIPNSILNSDEIIFSGTTWSKPSFEVYNKLRKESEYAAWLYVYGFRTNHFTVSVTHLEKLNSMGKINNFLKEHGFKMNTSGGEIKGTPQQFLEQSSIMADIIKVDFEEGEYEIPACYYEFAKRYKDDNNELYSGFIAKSADKIFESTNFYEK